MAHGALTATANTAASQTDSSLVTGLTGKRINVLALALMAGGTATDVTFNTKPSGSGTAISPLLACPIRGLVVLPYNQKGWFTTNTGDGLTVTTGAGATTGIQVVYEVIT